MSESQFRDLWFPFPSWQREAEEAGGVGDSPGGRRGCGGCYFRIGKGDLFTRVRVTPEYHTGESERWFRAALSNNEEYAAD
jgi:hypothetical protein